MIPPFPAETVVALTVTLAPLPSAFIAEADNDALIIPTFTSTLPVPVDFACIAVPDPSSVTLPVVVTLSKPFPVVSASMTPVAEPVDLISPPLAACLNSTPACPLSTKGMLEDATVIVALASKSTKIFVLPVLLNE